MQMTIRFRCGNRTDFGDHDYEQVLAIQACNADAREAGFLLAATRAYPIAIARYSFA